MLSHELSREDEAQIQALHERLNFRPRPHVLKVISRGRVTYNAQIWWMDKEYDICAGMLSKKKASRYAENVCSQLIYRMKKVADLTLAKYPEED